MEPYRNRAVLDQPVRVHLNLHRSKREGKPVYSVLQSGVVVAHAERLTLRDARFVVNAKRRDQVRASGKKNLHAWVEGLLDQDGGGERPVRYNPRELDHFECEGEVVQWAEWVHFGPDGMALSGRFGK